jgi:ABC-type multidrug transport system ATPase subunit
MGWSIGPARRRLLDGLSADLSRADLTVVLGPNGAGKSLTLRAIQGLIDCEAGAVSVLRDMHDPAARWRACIASRAVSGWCSRSR